MRCAAESGVALNKITVASKGFKLDSSLILHCPRFPDPLGAKAEFWQREQKWKKQTEMVEAYTVQS